MAFNWALSTLVTYRQKIAQLTAFARTSAHHAEPRLLVQTFLVQQLALGCAASTIRGFLSAIQALHTLGICSFTLDAAWWKLSTAATRLREDTPDGRLWFPLEALAERAQQAFKHEELTCFALTILALSFGLRIGEAAQLTRQDILGSCIPYIACSLRTEKKRPGVPNTRTRQPPLFVQAWALFLREHCPTLPLDRPFLRVEELQRAFHALFFRTRAALFPFHSLRRACARNMFAAGATIDQIRTWVGWQSNRMAVHYIGDMQPRTSCSIFSLPWSPIGNPPTCPIHPSLLDCLWPVRSDTQQQPTASPRRAKRARSNKG
jgi:integrase